MVKGMLLMLRGIIKMLGWRWFVFRIFYGIQKRIGWLRLRSPVHMWDGHGDRQLRKIDLSKFPEQNVTKAPRKAQDLLKGQLSYFSRHTIPNNFPPDWFHNPFSDELGYSAQVHWSLIPDFSVGDIKGVWEQNRFSFAYTLARAWQETGDDRYAEGFWRATEDWRRKNPPNQGVNWKCGQEVALRIIAWVFAYSILRQSPASTHTRETILADMVAVSARRINANISYALSQKNNHGISESAGLFTAGIVLKNKKWVDKGKILLETLGQELIYNDGSFSQHSTNYHRVMLHNYLWSIHLGRANGIEFSLALFNRIRGAGQWMMAMLDSKTGRVPNLGSNDGALVLPLTDCDSLDYRPTVQAVGILLDKKKWLPSGPWDALATWLGAVGAHGTTASVNGLCRTKENSKQGTGLRPPPFMFFPDGGFLVMRHPGGKMLFRCPRCFRHRPAHSDLLHVDLWHGGVNALRDAGTYSYNYKPPWQDYFRSTVAHNTIQFDNHDQMPIFSRFLFGEWPESTLELNVNNAKPSISAAFTDWRGCYHKRIVEQMPDGYCVTDHISGYQTSAVLRWRMAPEVTWSGYAGEWYSSICTIRVSAEPGPISFKMTTGWESLYYLEKTEIPVLEAVVKGVAQTVLTVIRLQ